MKHNVLRGEGARNFDIFIRTPNSSKCSKNCSLFELYLIEKISLKHILRAECARKFSQ